MATNWIENTKNSSSYTNKNKNSSSYINKDKGTGTISYFLDIGENYNLLIDSTYKLKIQSGTGGWNNLTKS